VLLRGIHRGTSDDTSFWSLGRFGTLRGYSTTNQRLFLGQAREQTGGYLTTYKLVQGQRERSIKNIKVNPGVSLRAAMDFFSGWTRSEARSLVNPSSRTVGFISEAAGLR
jgi:hypothetical protein